MPSPLVTPTHSPMQSPMQSPRHRLEGLALAAGARESESPRPESPFGELPAFEEHPGMRLGAENKSEPGEAAPAPQQAGNLVAPVPRKATIKVGSKSRGRRLRGMSVSSPRRPSSRSSSPGVAARAARQVGGSGGGAAPEGASESADSALASQGRKTPDDEPPAPGAEEAPAPAEGYKRLRPRLRLKPAFSRERVLGEHAHDAGSGLVQEKRPTRPVMPEFIKRELARTGKEPTTPSESMSPISSVLHNDRLKRMHFGLHTNVLDTHDSGASSDSECASRMSTH